MRPYVGFLSGLRAAAVALLLTVTSVSLTPQPADAAAGQNTRCVSGTVPSVPGNFCVRDRWHTQSDGTGIVVTDVWVWLSGCSATSDWRFPASSYSIRLRRANGTAVWVRNDALYASLGCRDHFQPKRRGTKAMYFNFFGWFGTQSTTSYFDVGKMSVD